ncbi:MAG: GNAT family N-acetyltransferase [Ruminococcus sp.]|nr:GNAT family N-acetyltransferase [Ruminococcus sp.]
MRIRKAEEKDIERISQLLRQVCGVHAKGRPDLFTEGGYKYSPEELRVMLHDKERLILAAADQDDIMVGYCFCEIQDHRQSTAMTHGVTLYIDDLCVDEERRGEHIGKALYEDVLRRAKEMGCYNVTLNVWESNPGARKIYEAMGMKVQKTGMETVL